MAIRKAWCPDRHDMIWINCNPQAGREMQDVHPVGDSLPKGIQSTHRDRDWLANDNGGV
ncbi:MAG: hypothetical protein ACYDAV_04685 [Gammaproteobacteria bacterium]